MVGEVYNYYVSNGRIYDYGDKKVDFYDNGFTALINFDFKTDAHHSYDSIFSKYDTILHGPLKNKTILNYISSHDDGGPFDKERKRTYESATKLMLTQGGAQIYYGDETARSLSVEAKGDAVLRSYMNWDELQTKDKKQLLIHWQKLGRFRNDHPSIGAGRHKKLNNAPYVFYRSLTRENINDETIVALDVKTKTELDISSILKNGKLIDKYNNIQYTVNDGKLTLNPGAVILLEKI
jgi:alpha-amylase